MKKFTVYKALGVLTFLFGLSIAFTAYIGRNRLVFTAESIFREFAFFFVIIIVGIGLMYSRRWAAIVFSMATLSAGLWLLIGSLLYVPFPYMLANLPLSIPLLFLTLIAVSCRDQLHGKKDLP